jgi:NitT/TauT family transport system substrate-binding protein
MRSDPVRTSISRRGFLGGGAALVAAAVAGCGAAPALVEGVGGRLTLRLLAFQAPSLGAFLPAVIGAQHIDRDHNLDIAFSYATPDNYNTEFASGHYQVGGSAALLSEGLRTERGVAVQYLFNLFDYYSTVVTSDPAIRSLDDLPSHSLAAATGTTNHAMFKWFADRQGLDLGDVDLLNQTPAGLSTMALLGRADATEIWEPAVSSLKAKKPDIRFLDLGFDNWKKTYGTSTIPYLGLAAHKDWALGHPHVIRQLYAIYSDAARWTRENPAKAAAVIAAATPKAVPATLQGLIEDNERLRLHVAPSADMRSEIEHVFAAGRSTGYLDSVKGSSVIYKGL